MSRLFDLSGRVALVPGGSGGIGSHVAELLAECGADVVVGYHSNCARAEDVVKNARALGRKADVTHLDATSYDAAKDCVARTIADYGRIDILAVCVGWTDGTFSLFKDQKPEQWQPIVARQFLAQVHLAHAVLPHFLERKAGRIISIGSDGAKGGQSGVAVSCGAIAGIIGFSKSLARDVGRHGITVNVVCPGPTLTPTLDALRKSGDTGAKLVEGAINAIPMKRAGDPREVAAAFAFLASDAGSYITGQALSVSGGLTMM
jgi:NAD(P)-dependent dehydrogenase (short-subunit alcohol dehydrogenase family)